MTAMIVAAAGAELESLGRMFRSYGDVDVVAACSDPLEGLNRAEELDPDLLLLDVRLDRLDGFELLSLIRRRVAPAVVFVGDEEQHAAGAYRVGALDFLLKPVREAEFHDALDRARRALVTNGGAAGNGAAATSPADRRGSVEEAGEARPPRGGYLRRILVRQGDRSLFIPVAQILWFGSANNYVRIHTAEQAFVIRSTLTDLESQLDPEIFVRIHRGIIVNLDHVREIKHRKGYEHTAVMVDGTKHRIGRTYRDRILG